MRPADAIELSDEDLRAVAGFAAACAQDALSIFEDEHPYDRRPREAIEASLAFVWRRTPPVPPKSPRAPVLRTDMHVQL